MYLVAFRTHVWDNDIAAIAQRALSCCGVGTFVVIADETKGPIDADPFFKVAHTDDFSSLSLPKTPESKSLWWNADYVLYYLRKQYPNFEYYIMLEYDALTHCNFDLIISECISEKIDMVVHQLKIINQGSHWSYQSIAEYVDNGPAWHALIPIFIINGVSIDKIYSCRIDAAYLLENKEIGAWPYCETWLPTIGKKIGLRIEELSRFANTKQLRFRPYLNIKEFAARKDYFFAHPVMGGERFIRSFISQASDGSYLYTDGRLCPELEDEDPSLLYSVLGNYFEKPSIQKNPKSLGLVNLSLNMPATQSSVSKWSRGRSHAEDASLAVTQTLYPDYAFHTDYEENPYWKIDLQVSHLVHFVEVINRSGVDRFQKFQIETSIDDNEYEIVYIKNDTRKVSCVEERPAYFQLNKPTFARYVKIVLNSHNYLHLRNIKIWGV